MNKQDEIGKPRRIGGDERIRTAGAAFAEPCLTTWRRRPIFRIKKMERETGIEPATFSLARRCSTTEPLPQTLAFARLRYHTRRELSTAFFPVEIKAFESFQA